MAGDLIPRICAKLTQTTNEDREAEQKLRSLKFKSYHDSCTADASVIPEHNFQQFFDRWLSLLNVSEQDKQIHKLQIYATSKVTVVEDFLIRDTEGQILYGHYGLVRAKGNVYFAWYVYKVEFTLEPETTRVKVGNAFSLAFGPQIGEICSLFFGPLDVYEDRRKELGESDIRVLKNAFKSRATVEALPALKALSF